MSPRQEITVWLANAVPGGYWVSYGDIGDALKSITGSGNGRGVAVTLTAFLDDVTTWHRIRDADGRWRGHQRVDAVPQGRYELSKDGGYIVGEASDRYNAQLVSEGVPVSSDGKAVPSRRFDLGVALRNGTIVLPTDLLQG